jgi:hypothetical protein
LQDYFRKYTIVLDDKKVDKIGRGESSIVQTDPGQHEWHLKIAWCRSPKLKLDLTDGKTVVLECRPNSNALVWPYWVTFGRNRAIAIRVLPDVTA